MVAETFTNKNEIKNPSPRYNFLHKRLHIQGMDGMTANAYVFHRPSKQIDTDTSLRHEKKCTCQRMNNFNLKKK